ncbi:hypothetical protein JCM11251_006627 [Rhodosporidiobolus azoricus]
MPSYSPTIVAANASKVGDPILLTDFPDTIAMKPYAIDTCGVAFSPTTFGCISPNDVIREIVYGTDDRMLIIDVRSKNDSSNAHDARQRFKFRGAYFFPSENAREESTKLFDNLPQDLASRIMRAEYVVFHCRYCNDRSPVFAANWAKKVKTALTAKDPVFKNYRADQKICLMHPGFRTFSTGEQLGQVDMNPFATGNFVSFA